MRNVELQLYFKNCPYYLSLRFSSRNVEEDKGKTWEQFEEWLLRERRHIMWEGLYYKEVNRDMKNDIYTQFQSTSGKWDSKVVVQHVSDG